MYMYMYVYMYSYIFMQSKLMACAGYPGSLSSKPSFFLPIWVPETHFFKSDVRNISETEC